MSRKKLSVDHLLKAVQVGSAASGSPQISPDGRWVVYKTQEILPEENQYLHNLWMTPTDGQSSPLQLTFNEPGSESYVDFRPRWSPDSKAIAYTNTEGTISLIRPENGEAVEVVGEKAHFEPGGFNGEVHWSPDGTNIAFLVSKAPEPRPDPSGGVRIDITKGANISSQVESPVTTLWTIDVATGAMEQLTDENFNVKGLCWSPDSTRLVLTALRSEEDDEGLFINADLYILEVATREIHPLLAQPGGNAGPTWSPDGKWIAFWSQMGSENWGFSYLMTPALIPADGGEPRFLLQDFREELSFFYFQNDFMWSRDSSELFFKAFYRLSNQLFRVPVEGGRFDRVTPDPDVWYDDFSFNGETFAFTQEDLTHPADIYVASIDGFETRRLTKVNPWWDDLELPQVKRIDYKSSDGKWDVAGFLILPTDFDEEKRYSVIVESPGGPAMVMLRFLVGTIYPNPVFASDGYVVFVPNTRGRSGGYGESFVRAAELEGSFWRTPLQDVIDGVDLLVSKGIADPKRVGIAGHSYGGGLAAMAVAQSDCFAAAAVHEGPVDFVSEYLRMAANPGRAKQNRNQTGLGSPYDPEDLKAMMKESPIYGIRNAKTPVLIEVGERSFVWHGSVLAAAMHSFGIPHEFFIYPKMGHVATEPRLIAEEIRRKADWFGYWLKDEPYSEPTKQVEFDEWKRKRTFPR